MDAFYCAIRRVTLRAKTEHQRDESGIALIMVAIFIVVLMGIGGFAVDFGNWYLHISRAQNAADSAALAGAVFLPDEPEHAIEAAKDNLRQNHVNEADIQRAQIQQSDAGTAELHVRLFTTADNAFIPLLGMPPTTTFTVNAHGRWQPGLGIGDYSNVLGVEGSDPSRTNNDQWQTTDRAQNQGQFWLAVGGSHNDKQNGDRYGAAECSDAAKCAGNRNLEFKADPDGIHTAGYEFVINAEPGQSANSIAIQVYDAGLYSTGDGCEGIGAIYAASSNQIRYVTGKNSFCAGDEESDNPTTTYYEVFDYKTKALVTSCGPEKVFPPVQGDLTTAWNQDPLFHAAFHDWYTMCSAPYDSATGSRYVLRVRAQIEADGSNYFSLRAGFTDGAPGPDLTGQFLPEPTHQSVRVFAKKDLPLWANMDGADTKFAIAKIPPSYAGQDVALDLYDLGDAGAPGTLSVVSSASTQSGASPTANCDWNPPGSNASNKLDNCTLPNVSSGTGFQGQIFTITWHVPDDYTCDPKSTTDSASCYMFLRFVYPPGTMVNDRTTWSASGNTQPLRLVEPKGT